MFLTIAVILLVLWIVGFGFFRAVVGGAIHVLLLIAIIALVWHFVSGHARRPGASSGDRVSAAFNGRAV